MVQYTFDYSFTFIDPEIWKSIHARFDKQHQPDCVSDVYDGTEYKKHVAFLQQPGNVSLLLNTDGVKMFNSSSVSLWPIWLVINELPPSERYVNVIA